MKRIIFFVLATVIFVLALAACNRNDTPSTTTTSSSINATTYKTVNTTKAPDNFDHAFSLKGLSYSPYEFSTPSSAAFVGLTTDDTLELFEFGYEGETVKEMTKTFYLGVDGYDAAQKDSIKAAMEENFADAEGLSGVTITHELTDKYYILTIELKSLDDSATLNADIRAGLIDYFTSERSSLSISAVEDVLGAYAFIKR